MSIYRFDKSSPVAEIALRKSADGGARVFICACDDLSLADAEKIKETLEKAHLAVVATEREGRACLEVRGTRTLAPVESALRAAGFINGTPDVSHVDNPKFSLKEKFKNNMMFIYGVANVIADMGYIAYGQMKEKLHSEGHSEGKKAWEDKAAGLSYMAGSATFTFFGRGDKSNHHVRDVALALRQELHSRGVDLSDDSAAVSFSIPHHQRSMMHRAKHVLQKHTSEIGNTFTGTAGALIMKGALKSDNPRTRLVDSALGVSTMVGGYGAALVKEKAPDPEHPPKGMFGKAKAWVQKNPNSLAGGGLPDQHACTCLRDR